TTRSTLFPYTTLFRSRRGLLPARPVGVGEGGGRFASARRGTVRRRVPSLAERTRSRSTVKRTRRAADPQRLPEQRACCRAGRDRSEEHTSELQSRENL